MATARIGRAGASSRFGWRTHQTVRLLRTEGVDKGKMPISQKMGKYSKCRKKAEAEIMGRVYRRKRKGRLSKNYYIEWNNENGKKRRLSVSPEKSVANRKLVQVEAEVCRRRAGETDPYEEHLTRPIANRTAPAVQRGFGATCRTGYQTSHECDDGVPICFSRRSPSFPSSKLRF